VIGLLATTVLLAFFPFAQSAIASILVNTLIDGDYVSSFLILLASAYGLFIFLPDVVSSLNAYLERRNYINLGREFQLLYFRKKSALDIQQFENPEFQDLINKAEDRDVWPLVNMSEASFRMLQSAIIAVFAVIVLAGFDWKLCLVVTLGVIPRFFAQVKYGKDTWSIWDAEASVRRRYGDLKSHFDNRTSLVELKLFQNVRNFIDRIATIMSAFSDSQKLAERRRLRYETLSTVLFGLIMGGASAWVIYRVTQGLVDVGTMLFVLASIDRFQSSLLTLLRQFASQQDWGTYADNLFKIIDTEPALHRSVSPARLGMDVTPTITFDNVSFAYPSSGKPILKNISLTIRPGEKFALVGENGAGKTTFVKLLCRVYDPTDGRILVDGRDLRDIAIEDWHRLLGVLFQDYASYNFAVKEAIALGRSEESSDMKRVVDAAQASDSESFILEWKGGYEQMLGVEFADGVDPSKGQKQRLAIARLFHRKAGLMILDEPTAAIDAEAEMRIFQRIESSTGGQTVVLISHKFSTVRKAHRICVFKDGGVEELGSHQELMDKGGYYAKLFSLQAKDYE
jgi:ATP-binding cassette subfamily B protein